MYLIRKRDALGQRFLELGIGHFDGGKIGIFGDLLLHDGNVDFQLFQNGGDGNVAAAVHGGINEFEIFADFAHRAAGKRQFGQIFIITLIDGGGHAADKGVSLLFHREIIANRGNKLHDVGSRLGRHLRAVLAVHFIAVIFFGIVAGGDHDARDRAQFTDGIGKHGNGMHVVIQPDAYAVGCENARRGFGELVRLSAGIERNRHAAAASRLAQRSDVFRKSLRCAAHGVYVHHIRAVADDAAHARRAELELCSEPVFYRLFVARDRRKFRFPLFAESRILQPTLVLFLIIHKTLL